MSKVVESIKTKQLNYADNVYILACVITAFKALYSFSDLVPHSYNRPVFSLLNVIIVVMLGYRLLFLQQYTAKRTIVFIFLGLATLYTDRTLHLFTMLLNFLILASSQNVDPKKTIKVLFKFEAIVVGFHVLMYPFMLFFCRSKVRFTYRNGEINQIRHQFLLQHANTFSMLLLWILLGYLYLNYCKLNISKIIVTWLIYFFFYQFADSNSGLIILSFVCLISILRIKLGETIELVVSFLAKYLFIILAVFFIIMMVIYPSLTGQAREVWDVIDIFFTGRMKFGAYAYDKVGFTLFGQNIPFNGKELWNGIWIDGIANDNFYMFLAVNYGLVYLVLIAYLFWRYSPKATFEEKLMFIAYSLYTMMEMYVTYTYFCFSLMLIMQYVWQEDKLSIKALIKR